MITFIYNKCNFGSELLAQCSSSLCHSLVRHDMNELLSCHIASSLPTVRQFVPSPRGEGRSDGDAPRHYMFTFLFLRSTAQKFTTVQECDARPNGWPGGQRKLNSYPSAWLQKNLVYHENPKNLRSINTTLSSYAIHDSRFTIDVHHSVFKLFTGLATAAFIACTLTVTKAITRAASPATKNIHHDICTR